MIFNFIFTILKGLIWLILKLFFRLRIQGTEFFPTKGGALLIANHVSLLDALIISVSVPRQVRFVMLKNVYDNPSLNWLFRMFKMVPVPNARTKDALEEFNNICQAVINQGDVLCIFPEGQLSKNGHLHGFKKGVEHIMAGVSAPVIPMHMDGLHGVSWSFSINDGKFIRPKLPVRRPTIRIKIGKPEHSKPSSQLLRSAVLELQTASLAEKVQDFKRFKTFENQSEATIAQVLGLKKVLPIRNGISVLNLLHSAPLSNVVSLLHNTVKSFQLCDTTQFKAQANEAWIKQKDIKVLLLDADDVASTFAAHPILSTQLELLFVNGRIEDENLYQSIADNNVLVLESLVYQDLIISVNIPDLETTDITGKKIVQKGHKIASFGRTIPGWAVKNAPEGLLIKGLGFENTQEWQQTSLPISVDEEGFLIRTNNN